MSDDKVYYTLYDPKKKADIGGRYSSKSGPQAAAVKSAKSDHVFPEKKDYTTAKTIYLRRMDNIRTEEKMHISCYKVTQKMIPAPPAYVKLTGVKGKIRQVKAVPCKE
jgi:hypothetical protein